MCQLNDQAEIVVLQVFETMSHKNMSLLRYFAILSFETMRMMLDMTSSVSAMNL